MKTVPRSLRIWFVIHFIIDMIFAVPLFFVPVWFLGLFGVDIIEPLIPRLVAAALIGIGGVSFFIRNKGREVYDVLLTLKILWSASAIVAFLIFLYEGGSKLVWIFLILFAVFMFVWIHYKNRLGKS